PVVRRARRERRPFAESVLERVRDRDRPRRARLLAHEARLALEDARLRLQQKSDEPPRPLGQIAFLIRVFASYRTWTHEVLKSAQHAGDDPKHLDSVLERANAVDSTEGPQGQGPLGAKRPAEGSPAHGGWGYRRVERVSVEATATSSSHRSTSP